MESALRAEPPRVTEVSTVVVTAPASSAYLSILRTATAGLAALLQFTLDEIEDLRIAVDEACAILLASHPAAQITSVGASLHQDAELSCRYTLDERSIEVQVSLSTLDDVELPSIHSFAWQVLRALTDTAGVAREDDRLVVTLRKQRRAP